MLSHASCVAPAKEMVVDDLGLGEADSGLSSSSVSTRPLRKAAKAHLPHKRRIVQENPFVSVDFPVGGQIIKMREATPASRAEMVSFEAS